ncbi:hypothetical protein [Enterococcus faecium]|uniref:hypothetical protein n=1 Tax=Enterococcus faecium TaxID=1352 RepID=UPI003F79F851
MSLKAKQNYAATSNKNLIHRKPIYHSIHPKRRQRRLKIREFLSKKLDRYL